MILPTLCQSCGILDTEQLKGTRTNGLKRMSIYAAGAFVEPDMTF
jgi:hypothetical protein